MVKFTYCLSIAAILAIAPLFTAGVAQADNLLIERVQQEQGMQLPARGLTMSQVEQRYGAPERKLNPRGGDSTKHPLIKRWDYARFIVYFEHDHVIHSVLNTPAGNNTHPASVE